MLKPPRKRFTVIGKLPLPTGRCASCLILLSLILLAPIAGNPPAHWRFTEPSDLINKPLAQPILTDTHRQVTVYRFQNRQDAERYVDSLSTQLKPKPRPRNRVLQLSQPNHRSNCHGWVFTGGRWWVSENDVELILLDNSYSAVAEPQMGDLAIYRDADGMITHSALVFAICVDGELFVEGKRGLQGVFLHPAEPCDFGEVIYYRSPRKGHLLLGVQESRKKARPGYERAQGTATSSEKPS